MSKSVIKPTSTPALFRELRDDSANFKERNDCAVVAVAAVARVSYAEAHKAMAAQGRKNGRGAYVEQTLSAIHALGRTTTQIDPKEMMRRYPSPHRELLKNVTTHHPRRFPGAFDPTKRYLLRVSRHILAVVGGEVNDWTINKALRVKTIHEVN